ncbi:hypothetical protein B0H13DRAFT_2370825 [Mycena leptocephala]|nr:hypothetical protein B0H13DRAFT_2370825 [Mycena leptocephala]
MPSHFHLHEWLLDFRCAIHACSPFPARARPLFPARLRPLTVSWFPARPRPLAFPLRARRFPLRARRFLHTRSLFPARPRPLAVSHAPARCLALLLCLALSPLPHASSSASHFLLRLALPLRLAGKAEPGAERDINWL